MTETSAIAHAIKQTKPFDSKEYEVVLALQLLSARVVEPLAQYLKKTAQLTVSQYNVLRILRGARPTHLACTEIGERMVAKDPDVTRLLDRLAARGLINRERHSTDRRVMEVGISKAGLDLLEKLDAAVRRYPKAMLSHLGPKRLDELNVLLQDALATLGTFEEDTTG